MVRKKSAPRLRFLFHPHVKFEGEKKEESLFIIWLLCFFGILVV